MKTSHDYGNEAVTIVTEKGNKKDTFVIKYAETVTDPVEAIKLIRKEVKAAESAYRGVIGFVLETLRSLPQWAGKGQDVDIEQDVETGEERVIKVYRAKMETEADRKQANSFKQAFRTEIANQVLPTLRTLYKDPVDADDELSTWLAGGTFAVAASKARKFYYVTGKLPCAYDKQGHPDISRALSIPAMDKIMAEFPERDSDKSTFVDKLRKLRKEWDDSKDRGEVSDQAALFAALNDFTIKAEESYLKASQGLTAAILALNGPNVGEYLQPSMREVEDTEEVEDTTV